MRNQVLFVFLILAHDRRRILRFDVTANPTAEWTAQQIVEAFPWDDAPRYLLRDRDRIYGLWRLPPSPREEHGNRAGRNRCAIPLAEPYVERLIGSIRRGCLDHMIVLNEKHLRRILINYFRYYHRWRTHQSLEMDAPDPRPVQSSEDGRVIEIPEVGGLHHHYERIAA